MNSSYYKLVAILIWGLLNTSLFAQESVLRQGQALLEKAEIEKGDLAFSNALATVSAADSLLADTPVSQLRADVKYMKAVLLYNLGNYYLAIKEAEQAEGWFASLGLPGRQADCLIWNGQSRWYTEGNEAALKYFEAALKLVEREDPPGGVYRGKYYADKGFVLAYMGRMGEAISWIDRGLKKDIAHFGEHHRNTAQTLFTKASYYHIIGDQPRALRVFQRIEKIYDAVHSAPNTVEHALVYASLGKSFFYLSQLSRAENYLVRAKAVLEEKLPRGHFNTLNCYVSLGEIYFNLELFDESDYYYRLAEENNIRQDASIKAVIESAHSFRLEHQGKYREANELLIRQLEKLDDIVQTSNNRGLLLERIALNEMRQDKPGAALPYLKEASKIYGKNSIGDNGNLARIDAFVARVFRMESKLDSALFYAQRGIDRLYEPHHDFSQIPNADIFSLLLEVKALILEGQGSKEQLNEALEVYFLGDRYFDFQRTSYSFQEDKVYLQDVYSYFYQRAIKLCLLLGKDDPALIRKAFQLSERNKAYSLLETVRRTSIPRLEGFLRQQQDLRAQINFYEDKLGETEEAQPGGKWAAAIAELREEYVQLEKRARAEFPDLLLPFNAQDFLSVGGVRQLLRE